MSVTAKHETGEAAITIRLPRALKDKVERRIANRYSTMSEYIRELIRADVLTEERKREEAHVG